MIKILNCLSFDINIIYKVMYFHDNTKYKPEIIKDIPNDMNDYFKPAILKVTLKDDDFINPYQELEIHKYVVENK